MKIYIKYLYLLLSAPIFLCGLSYVQNNDRPALIIYDTDMGPMIDDVAAIAMLHAFVESGEAELLATVASNSHSTIAQVIDIFNTYFGRPKIPIGVPKGPAVNIIDTPNFNMYGGWTDYLANKYPSTIRSNDVAADAVDVYRRVLSNQPDNSVTIVTVGFLTNIADLLASGPDEISDLTGLELVEKKVKLMVSMAGVFPSGREYNLYMDTRASKIAFEYWPTEIIFSGFEIGMNVQTGYPLIQNRDIENSPVRDVFKMKVDRNRSSFDQTAVLVAVKGVDPYYNLVPGRITVNLDGSNGWDENGEGHYYLVENAETKIIEDLINELIQHQPN
jgi:pyrimidine-specific ribonucleoside hydrolase